MAAEPEPWPVLEERMNELLPLALAFVAEPHEGLEKGEELPFGIELETVTSWATANFARRFTRIGKAGRGLNGHVPVPGTGLWKTLRPPGLSRHFARRLAHRDTSRCLAPGCGKRGDPGVRRGRALSAAVSIRGTGQHRPGSLVPVGCGA